MSRGAAPGERRGGRGKGTPNKINLEIKQVIDSAVDHAELARGLARIALHSESDQARVAAIRELWDRRFGKPTQPVSGDAEGGPVEIVIRREIIDPAN